MNDPRFKNNATMQNAFSMYKNGNTKGIEELGMNVCQTQGRDINSLINQAKNYLNQL